MLLRSQILELRPDLLTIYFGAWNNFTPAVGSSDAKKAPVVTRVPGALLILRAAKNLRMFQAIEQGIDSTLGARRATALTADERERYIRAFRDGRPPEGPRVSVPEFEANLQQMVDLAETNGVAVVLLTQEPLSADSRREFPIYYQYRDAIHRLGARANVIVVDAADALERDEQAGRTPFSDSVNPSGRGHALIAERLTASIQQLAASGHLIAESKTAQTIPAPPGHTQPEVVDLLPLFPEAVVRTQESRYVQLTRISAGAVHRNALFMHPVSRVSLPLPGSGILETVALGVGLSDEALEQGARRRSHVRCVIADRRRRGSRDFQG